MTQLACSLPAPDGTAWQNAEKVIRRRLASLRGSTYRSETAFFSKLLEVVVWVYKPGPME